MIHNLNALVSKVQLPLLRIYSKITKAKKLQHTLWQYILHVYYTLHTYITMPILTIRCAYMSVVLFKVHVVQLG